MTHHQLIRSLVSEIRRLRDEVDTLNEQYYEEAESMAFYSRKRAEKAASDARAQLDEAQERLREAEYRESERRAAIDQLEQARRYGNEYREKQALAKLKSW